MKYVHAYYFKSDSGDIYTHIEKSNLPAMTVYEIMVRFDWDYPSDWIRAGYKLEEIPYADFRVMSIEL